MINWEGKRETPFLRGPMADIKIPSFYESAKQLREVSLEDELERCSTLSTIRNLTLPIKQGLLPKKIHSYLLSVTNLI